MNKKIAIPLICAAVLSALTVTGKKHNDQFAARPLPAAVTNTNPALQVKNEAQKKTLSSLTRVDAAGELYLMDYSADYGLEDLIAAGGVKSNEALMGYVQEKLLNAPKVAATLNDNFGCSSFLVRGRDGHVLFCRNFDYDFPSPVSIITRTRGTIGTCCMNMAIKSTKSATPDDGKSDVSFYVAAPLACVDGMNRHGVAISVLVVKSYGAEQHESGKSDITTTAVIREILYRAKTVDEALAIFDSHNFFAHGGEWKSNYHFFLADATGRSVVVEYVNSGRDAKDDKDYRMVVTEAGFVTNNFIYKRLREPLSDSWRESAIEGRISAVKGKTDAFKLLCDVSQIKDPDLKKTVRPGEPAGPNSYPETLCKPPVRHVLRFCTI